MKTVYVLGRGQSLRALAAAKIESGSDVILMNDHSKTLENPQMAAKLSDANLYIMCNINQAGFVPAVFDRANIAGCLTNRFKPDWDLWRKQKTAQRKHNEGGTLNNLGRLPYLAEDEPYLYTWRGPADRNHEVMTTYNDRIIEHMPEEAEQYLMEVYENKLVCNCSYYGTLYALVKLKADRVVYYGLDFYENVKIQKKWFMDPPPYLSAEWYELRMRYEGEHMRLLWDDYLARYFPDAIFEFNTTAALDLKSKNILCNPISFEGAGKASSTYY
jgi:hypothetical protein